MARIARVVLAHHPHHVTQRGSRRQQVFFGEADYQVYLSVLAEQCRCHDLAIWAYCLMPNHVHLLAVPASPTGLSRPIAEAHRRYARHVNFREGWRGHLWQERFASFLMDEAHLAAAARYVELNPVRAGLVSKSEEWPWSSARAHLAGTDDGLMTARPLLQLAGDWRSFLGESISEADAAVLRLHGRTGRPLGSDKFLARVEKKVGRRLRPERPGPKSKSSS